MSADDPACVAASATGLLGGPGLGDSLPVLGMLAAVLIGESALISAVLTEDVPAALLVPGHGVAIGAFLWVLALRHRHGWDLRLAALAALTVAMAGPLGAVVALGVFAIHALLRPAAGAGPDHHAFLFPEPQANPADTLVDEIIEGRRPISAQGVVLPFAEVMAIGDLAEKQSVLGHILERFQPAFAPTLHAALGDTEPTVRIQAAIVMSRLERRFDQRTMAFERELSAGTRAACLAMARHLDAMAFSGLPNEWLATEMRERALELFRAAAAGGVDDVALEIGRLLLRLEWTAEAALWFGGLALPPEPPPRLTAWRLESLMRGGKLAEVRDLCRRHGARLSASEDLSPAVRQAVTLWMEAA